MVKYVDSAFVYEVLDLVKDEHGHFMNVSSVDRKKIENVMQGFIYFVATIMTLGIAGNLLVVWTVVRSPSLYIPLYMTAASLAVCDALTLAIAPTAVIWHDYELTFTHDWCYVSEFLSRTFPLASSLHIVLIAFDRFLTVRYPLQARSWLTNRRTFAIIIAIYVVSLLLHVYLIYRMEYYIGYCSFKQERYTWTRWFDLCLTILRIVLPLVMLIFLNLSIARVLVQRTRLSRRMAAEGTGVVGELAHVAVNMTRRNRALIMIGIIISLYTVLTWPICIMTIILSGLPGVGITVVSYISRYKLVICMTAGRVCLYVNAATNPIIYAVISSNFRKRIVGSFRKYGARESPTAFSSTQGEDCNNYTGNLEYSNVRYSHVQLPTESQRRQSMVLSTDVHTQQSVTKPQQRLMVHARRNTQSHSSVDSGSSRSMQSAVYRKLHQSAAHHEYTKPSPPVAQSPPIRSDVHTTRITPSFFATDSQPLLGLLQRRMDGTGTPPTASPSSGRSTTSGVTTPRIASGVTTPRTAGLPHAARHGNSSTSANGKNSDIFQRELKTTKNGGSKSNVRRSSVIHKDPGILTNGGSKSNVRRSSIIHKESTILTAPGNIASHIHRDARTTTPYIVADNTGISAPHSHADSGTTTPQNHTPHTPTKSYEFGETRM